MADHPFFTARSSRPRIDYFGRQARRGSALALARSIIPISAFIGFGAFLQLALTTAIPQGLSKKYLVPLLLPIGLLTWAWGWKLLQHFGFAKLDDDGQVVFCRATAVLPDSQDPTSTETPEMCILMIGAKSRQPLGFDKNFVKIGEAFAKIWKDAEKDPDSGLLHVEGYQSTETPYNSNLMSCGYFRSAADVVKLAHSPRHRQIWQWYYSLPEKDQQMMTIWHEMFQVKQGGIDVVGVNWKPRGLAAAFTKTPPMDVGDGYECKKQADVKGEQELWYPVLRPLLGKKLNSTKDRMSGVDNMNLELNLTPRRRMAVLVLLLKIILIIGQTQSTFKVLAAARHYHAKPQEPSKSTTSRLRRKLKLELQYWVVFIFLNSCELLCDKFVSWILPFYNQIKLVCWLLAGTTLGSQLVYKKAIAPLVKPYESTLDMLGTIASTVIVAVLACLCFGPRKLSDWWGARGTSKAQEEVPTILQGLRSASKPKLAHRLADSIESAHAKLNTDVSTRLAQPILTDPRRYSKERHQNVQASAGTSADAAPAFPAEPEETRLARQSRTPRQSLYPEVATLPAVVKIETPPAQHVASFGQHVRRQSSSAKGKGRAIHTDKPPASPRQTSVVPSAAHQEKLDAWAEADLDQLTASTNTPIGVPPTPAPPGAFSFSHGEDIELPALPTVPKTRTAVTDSGPLRASTRLSELGPSTSMLSTVQSSPRQQASRAIADLTAELDDDFNNNRGLSGWVNGSSTTKTRKKQSRLRDVTGGISDEEYDYERDDVGATPKSKRTGGKRTRLSGHSTLEEILQQSKAADGTSKSLSKRKRKATNSDEDDEYVEKAMTTKPIGTKRHATNVKSSIPSAAVTKNTTSRLRASVSTRDVRSAQSVTVTGLPPSRATASGNSTSRVPVVAKSTQAGRVKPSVRVEALAVGSSSSSDEMSLPAPAQSSNKSSSAPDGALNVGDGRTSTKPPRKARRLVGSTRTRAADDEVEVDGVPVVVNTKRTNLNQLHKHL
ncbi:hypothetical protein OIV83_006083 [Microbotryomycetes sp. JL201]|nr:hypothetical protein OIV83_006083 [Microbotryomycetes sp. JL201]